MLSFASRLTSAGLLLLLGCANGATLPGPLVSVQWLHQHAAEVQIVDIRDDLNSLTADPQYKTVAGKKMVDQVGGYIPDALSVNFWALRETQAVDGQNIDFMLPSPGQFQEVMRASQLEPGKPVVLVPTGDDSTSLQEAAFLAWELQLFGQAASDIALLDGGTHAWLAAGFAVDNDAIAPMDSGHWSAQPARADMLADAVAVQAAQRQHALLLDTRPLAQYIGAERTPVVPRAGRLAGARPLPAELLYTRDDAGAWHFLPADQARHALALDGVGALAPSIVYCNTGQYAAGAWFELEHIMGLHGVREFPGGMHEWELRGLPIEGL